MNDFERDVERMLQDRAAALPDAYDASPAVVARARRRRAIKAGALTLAVVLVAAGSAATIAGVVGRDDSRHLISTAPPGPTTSGTTNATTTPDLHAGPLVESVVCPKLEAIRPDRPPVPPATAPRAPAAGDPATYGNLASFGSIVGERYTVLGPKAWSCLTQFAADGGAGMVIYPPAATPGQVPDGSSAPISVSNDYLWHGAFPLPCQVSTLPAVLVYAASVGMTCKLPAERTLTHVDDHGSTFIDADGTRGAAWMKLPSSEGTDGLISIVTCRPTEGLSAADCDTITEDYITRVSTAGVAAVAPKPTVVAPFVAGSWTATTDGIAITDERGSTVAAYDLSTDRWQTFEPPPFSDAFTVVAARGDAVYVRANPSSSSAPTTEFAALDRKTGAWRSLAPVPADVPYFNDTTGDAGHIFGVGAFEYIGDPMPPARRGAIAVEYDVTTDRWTRLPASPLAPASGFTLEWTGSQLLIWSGGSTHQGCVPAYPDGAAYDSTARTWRTLPEASVPERYTAAHVWTGTEMIVWGGDPNGGCGGPPVGAGGAYNPATNQWRKLPNAPVRAGHAPFAVWNGSEMFVQGGDGSGHDAVAAYNPATNTWRTLPAPPGDAPAPDRGGIGALVDGQVLLGPLTGPFVYPAVDGTVRG